MKLLDAMTNAFDLRIKQFLTASNIDFSDIFRNTFIFCVTTLCIKSAKIVLGLVHLKKHRIGRKEGNVLFNDALNTFYLRLYGFGHMVKDHSDSER